MATLDKPEVLRIGRQLGLSREAVVGYLIRFWGWFGDNSVDGHVDAVEARDVDVVLSLPGFADAMIAVKWLAYDVGSQRLTMPNFDRHNGESSKKRALKSRRQANYRDGLVDANVDAAVDADSTTKRPLDKNREDKNKNKGAALPDWIPAESWNAWIKSRKNRPTAEAKRLAVMELEKLRADGNDPKAVLDQSTFRGWTGLFPIKDSNPVQKVNAI